MPTQNIVTPEKHIQSACIDYLTMLENKGELYFFRSQAGAVSTVRPNGTTGYMRTGRPGVPDITVCYLGHFVGLEIKTTSGKQSDHQLQAERMIEKACGYYFVIRSVLDLVKNLKNIKNKLG